MTDVNYLAIFSQKTLSETKTQILNTFTKLYNMTKFKNSPEAVLKYSQYRNLLTKLLRKAKDNYYMERHFFTLEAGSVWMCWMVLLHSLMMEQCISFVSLLTYTTMFGVDLISLSTLLLMQHMMIIGKTIKSGRPPRIF